MNHVGASTLPPGVMYFDAFVSPEEEATLAAILDNGAWSTELKRTEGYCRNLPDQVIANEYLPGQGISAHIDCVPCFDDTIVSISLLSACEMVFRDVRGPAACGVLLQPRSGVLLRDSGRYGWTHEIPARKSDIVNGVRTDRSRRFSLTFRKVIAPKRS